MNTRLPAVLMILCLCLPLATKARSEEAGYWEQMKNRLATIAPQKKGPATTAVGGTRGSKDQTADSLYWKDEEQKRQVPEEEYARFMVAFESAAAGKKEEARGSFEAFLQDYPQSLLGDEARSALQELQQP